MLKHARHLAVCWPVDAEVVDVGMCQLHTIQMYVGDTRGPAAGIALNASTNPPD